MAPFATDDGVFQDGALFIHLPSSRKWWAIFAMFASQSLTTHDVTGRAPTGGFSTLPGAPPSGAVNPAPVEPSEEVRVPRTTTTYGGDRVSVDPPAGAVATTTISDARGKTTSLLQYTGAGPTGTSQATNYTYDQAGRLSKVVDPAGNQWTYGYDLRGLQTSATDPDKGTTTSTYDDAGQLLTTTDARGVTLASVYDQLGRKTQLRENTATGTLRSSWEYDTLAKGLLTSSTRISSSWVPVRSPAGWWAVRAIAPGSRIA